MRFIGLFDLLCAVASHDEVEVLLCTFVRDAVDQDDRVDIHAGRLAGKKPLKPLEHQQDFIGHHAPVLVVVAQ